MLPLDMVTYLNPRQIICVALTFSFLLNSLVVMPIYAQDFRLPAPGTMVPLSLPYNPPILKGIKIHPDNPFRFDFILDVGDGSKPSLNRRVMNPPLQEESTRLIKYFLASLTIPEKDLWVNLSPYEKNRIIPHSFGQTEMGRDLLAEDYMLKQITASLIYPEGQTGKKFWKRIYAEAAKKFGTTNIPVNTFNKVWIVPEKAVVYENAKAGTAYVVESKLKVMLEQDYLALYKNNVGVGSKLTQERAGYEPAPTDINQLGSQIVREIVIPELTKEVNEGKNFSQLRQVYNSLILATWYKKKIQDSILEKVYVDQRKTSGVGYGKLAIGDPQYIYQQYLKAFKKGVYNYIKEEQGLSGQQTVPRKYFSGGADFVQTSLIVGHTITRINSIDLPQDAGLEKLEVDAVPESVNDDKATIAPTSMTLGGFDILKAAVGGYLGDSLISAFESGDERLQKRLLDVVREWCGINNIAVLIPFVQKYQIENFVKRYAMRLNRSDGVWSSPPAKINLLLSLFPDLVENHLSNTAIELYFAGQMKKGKLRVSLREPIYSWVREHSVIIQKAVEIINSNYVDQAMNALVSSVTKSEVAMSEKSSANYTGAVFPKEGYSINLSRNTNSLFAPESLTVSLYKDQKLQSDQILFYIFPKQRVIYISLFSPRFPHERLGRGRALLRSILNSNEYAGFHVIASANSFFRGSLRQMPDFNFEESEFPLGLEKRRKFVNLMIKGFVGGLKSSYQRQLREWISKSNVYGVVPGQGEKANAAMAINDAQKIIKKLFFEDELARSWKLQRVESQDDGYLIEPNIKFMARVWLPHFRQSIQQKGISLSDFRKKLDKGTLDRETISLLKVPLEYGENVMSLNLVSLKQNNGIANDVIEHELKRRIQLLVKSGSRQITICLGGTLFGEVQYAVELVEKILRQVAEEAGESNVDQWINNRWDVKIKALSINTLYLFDLSQKLHSSKSIVHKNWVELEYMDLLDVRQWPRLIEDPADLFLVSRSLYLGSWDYFDRSIRIKGLIMAFLHNAKHFVKRRALFVTEIPSVKNTSGYESVSIPPGFVEVIQNGNRTGVYVDRAQAINKVRARNRLHPAWPISGNGSENRNGGIDLTSDKALLVQNNGQAIKFHIDPSQLRKLENAPGFAPVIINMQPIVDIRGFLGINTITNGSFSKPANDNQPAVALRAA